MIRTFHEEKPEARQVVLSKSQHEMLCQELLQAEGRPVRVYVFDRLTVRVMGDA
jgi:hypothetical protein